MFANVQGVVLVVLWLLTLGLKLFAVIDCVRRPAPAFPAVGRQSKALWLVLTALGALAGVLPNLTVTIFGLAGIVIALVYLFDVRTRIIDITNPR